MDKLSEINEKIKILKSAREILHKEYLESDFHKKRESQPHETLPPSPEDEEVYKLLTALQQIDVYIKKYQEEQFKILKEKA